MVIRMMTSLLLLQRATAFAPGVRNFARTPTVARAASGSLEELYNHQVTNELSASQVYLAASMWCDKKDLVGMASYMRVESDDERGHALEFIDFGTKRDLPLSLEAIKAPQSTWKTIEELWGDLLGCERENTQSLLKLADAAQNENDHSLTTFLMPFHMEQVDSEDKLRTILAKVKDENRTPGLIRQLDTELGSEAASHSGK